MLVKSVTISGASYPVMFGMHLTEIVQREASKGGFTGVKMQAVIIHAGHENYCLAEGLENKLTFKEAFKHVDAAMAEGSDEQKKELSDILDAYMNSKPVKDMLGAVAAIDDSKKKVAGKK